jgi:hydrogenase maturation protease
MKILFYAYGNPGRQDDGLGVFLCDELIKWAAEKGIKNIDFDSNYQLNAEDSFSVSGHDLIIFADAVKKQKEPFRLKKIKPSGSIAFSTHSMSPESVLALCEELYKKRPKAYMLAIKGYKWEVNEPLSAKAKVNLRRAGEFMKKKLQNPEKF